MRDYQFDHNLNNFRDWDKQQKTMLSVMDSNQGLMSLALSHQTIIGYAIILEPEPDERWRQLDFIKILGVVEVAPNYRNQKVAQSLLQSLFLLQETEKFIVISLALCWHWDLSMTNGDSVKYMHMLKRVLGSVGFEEYETNEPDIARYDVNFMTARTGKNITTQQVNQFTNLAMNKRFLQ
ncbi:hypothetical protein [Bacillus marasmi]|uniref:hypothetical protein n=1 Tax=Bacillus marasmi TaxID=1926279 RepID=UPI0011CBFB36|nr:hypothetical protein [Bacillus marasmi]